MRRNVVKKKSQNKIWYDVSVCELALWFPGRKNTHRSILDVVICLVFIYFYARSVKPVQY